MTPIHEFYFAKPYLRHQKAIPRNLQRKLPTRFGAVIARRPIVNWREVFVAGLMSGTVGGMLIEIARRLA